MTQFIERQNDKDWLYKIRDELNLRDVKLSKGDIELIQRIRAGKVADKNFNPEDFTLEFANEHKFIHPFQANEPKRRFQPSKWERLRINKIV